MANDATNVYGTLVEVSTINVGEGVTADAAIGATVISVFDPATFNELGGQVQINGKIYLYVSTEPVDGTITLDATTPLLDAATLDDRVEIYPPAPLKQALIDLGVEESEPVWVTVPHAIAATLDEGRREEADRESVLLTERAVGEPYIADVQTSSPGLFALGAAIDLDTVLTLGTYVQPSSAEAGAGTNYPIPYAGFLEVFPAPAPSTIVVQRYTAYFNGDKVGPSIWGRSTSGTWSPWVPIYDDHGDDTTVSSVIVAASGWSVDSAVARLCGKVLSLRVNFTRTGSTITSTSNDGDVGNVTIGTLTAKYRPNTASDQHGLGPAATGKFVAGYVTPGGNVNIGCIVPGFQASSGATYNAFANGESMSLGGTILIA